MNIKTHCDLNGFNYKWYLSLSLKQRKTVNKDTAEKRVDRRERDRREKDSRKYPMSLGNNYLALPLSERKEYWDLEQFRNNRRVCV